MLRRQDSLSVKMKVAIVYFENEHNKDLIDIISAENCKDNAYIIDIIKIYDNKIETNSIIEELIKIKVNINYTQYDYIIKLSDSSFIKDYLCLTNLNENTFYIKDNNYIFKSSLLNHKKLLASQIANKLYFNIINISANICDLQIKIKDNTSKYDILYKAPVEWNTIKNKIIKTNKNIGIFYICLGKYSKFWPGFYNSAITYLFPDCNIHFYVYTDDKTIKSTKNITVIYGVWGPWPNSAMQRFNYYLQTYNLWKNEDYLYFFNANTRIIKPILGSDFTKNDLIACIHISFKDPKNINRCEGTRAYLKNPIIYAFSGLQGAKTLKWKGICEILNNWAMQDLEENIIPPWHDESYFNRYINENLESFSKLKKRFHD